MSAFEKTNKNLQRHSAWDGRYFQEKDKKTQTLTYFKELQGEDKSDLKTLSIDPNKYEIGPPKFTKDLHHIEKWLVKSIITPGPQTPIPNFSLTNNPEGYRQLTKSTTSAFRHVMKKERPMQSAIDFLSTKRRLKHYNRPETPIVQPIQIIKGINNPYHVENPKGLKSDNDNDDVLSLVDNETGDVFTFIPMKEGENPTSTRVGVRRNNDELMEIDLSNNLNEFSKEAGLLPKDKIKKELADVEELSEILIPDLSCQSHITIHEEELDEAGETIQNVTKSTTERDDKEENCNNSTVNYIPNATNNHENDMVNNIDEKSSEFTETFVIDGKGFEKLREEDVTVLADVPNEIRMKSILHRGRTVSHSISPNSSSSHDTEGENDKENDDEVAAITEDQTHRNKSLRIKSAKVRTIFSRTESAVRKKEFEAERLKMIKENADYLKRFQVTNMGDKTSYSTVHLLESRSMSRIEDSDEAENCFDNESKKVIKRKLSETLTPTRSRKRQKLTDEDPPILTKEEPCDPEYQDKAVVSPLKGVKPTNSKENKETSHRDISTKNLKCIEKNKTASKTIFNDYSDFQETESNAQQLLKRMYEDPIETEVKT